MKLVNDRDVMIVHSLKNCGRTDEGQAFSALTNGGDEIHFLESDIDYIKK